MNKSTDTTTGMPNPPLRIIAPKGAPIKKNTKQANDNVNFLCHSISERITYSSLFPAYDSSQPFAAAHGPSVPILMRFARLDEVSGTKGRTIPGQELLKTLFPLPRRVLALLIGGGDANYRINPAWAERTLPLFLEAAESSKTALLVTTSRRTGEKAKTAIEAILHPNPATHFLLLASRDESNPLPAPH